jgi:hypothetical protein
MGNKTFTYRVGIAVLVMAVVTAELVYPSVVEAQTFSPYSDFQAMTLGQLATLQVKLTFVGSQQRALQSVALTSSSNTLDLDLFVPFQRPGISYFNDTVAVRTFSASPEELKAVIDNVGTLPNVTGGGVAADVFLSFALFNSQPSNKAFEAILNKSDAAALFDQLRLSLANNKDGLRKISEMACPLDLLEAARPTDVSGNVNVVLRGVRLDRSTGRFVGTALVTNNSATALASPVSLVVDLEGNVKLANADGTTCGTSPVGREFINLSNSLGPGETVEVGLQFNNPDLEEIKMTTKVLSGPGAR